VYTRNELAVTQFSAQPARNWFTYDIVAQEWKSIHKASRQCLFAKAVTAITVSPWSHNTQRTV